MTGMKSNFLSLTAYQGGSVTFGDDKKGEIIGIGKIGKSPSHFIDNVYHVKGLKYNLLSISQLCDRGNKVEFTMSDWKILNDKTGELVLEGKRHNNVYTVHVNSISENNLTCLSVLNDDPTLWHSRSGHANMTLLNKFINQDLVVGLPKIKCQVEKVCDACAKGKHVRTSFKLKNIVSTLTERDHNAASALPSLVVIKKLSIHRELSVTMFINSANLVSVKG
ncbi:hypothetical protein Dimus_038299 [Dionaea muscipula]